MPGKPILLKALLRQRHLQTHRAFCREYDKLAEKADKQLVGGWPSKAQFYRWLSGDLVGLPYADHCLLLETMFPEWKVEQLFEPHNGGIEYIPKPPPARQDGQPSTVKTAVADPASQHVADIVAAFASRSDFTQHVTPRQLFDGAESIRMVGLSLNMLCQQYPDKALLDLLESGTTVECLFLDPQGRHITMREEEEEHTPGTLTTLTDVNIRTMARGLPLCATSLALIHHDIPVVAVINAPFLGLRYHATTGGGAYYNDTLIHASETTELKRAIVSLGDYATGPDAEQKNRRRFAVTQALAENVERIRMFGAASLDLAWVAEGRTDACVILSNKPWDTAAGVLIAREAGAHVTDDTGAAHTIESTATVAAAPAIGRDMFALTSHTAIV